LNGLQFLPFTIEDDKHDEDADNVQAKSDEHERTLVAGEESGRGAQAEDGQNVGDVVEATGNHGGNRSAAARAHERARVPHGCGRNEEAETQNGIKRGLDAKADVDGQNVPTVEQELPGGVIPALRPGDDAEIDSRHKRGAKQKSGKGDEITFHITSSCHT